MRDEKGFERILRSAIRAFWSGTIDINQFFEQYARAIEKNLTAAWVAGAEQFGVSQDELSPDEEIELDSMIQEQKRHIFSFALDVEDGQKEKGGLLRPFLLRAAMWASVWSVAFDRGGAMANEDQKMKWVLGEAEHCTSCLKLEGKVKRYSFWMRSGILPRVNGATYLDCKGYNCQCNLVPTSDPVSRGPLPRLP